MTSDAGRGDLYRQLAAAVWEVDGRQIVELGTTLRPLDEPVTRRVWKYGEQPPDGGGWILAGVTADGERLWVA